jgi:hypothetical protein
MQVTQKHVQWDALILLALSLRFLLAENYFNQVKQMVTKYTMLFHTKELRSLVRVCLCVSYNSRYIQVLFIETAFSGWALQRRRSVLCLIW